MINTYDDVYTSEQTSAASDPIVRPDSTSGVLRTATDQRFISALACLGAAWALSWTELALTLIAGFPADAPGHPLAASIASRMLIGLLYLCVAARLQWARWLTVAVGFGSVLLVAPMLAVQWHVFPAAAIVSGAALVCKCAASLYLLSPMPMRANA
jgi:hypothetical protein